jgi:hypothetical protein
MAAELDEIRRALPKEQALWDALLERVARWTPAPAPSESPADSSTGRVGLAFGPAQWREYLVAAAARRAPDLSVDRINVADLDWQGIDDMLQEAIDSGYPWVGLRDEGLVGLAAPDGEPWVALADPADGTAKYGGSWSPAPR